MRIFAICALAVLSSGLFLRMIWQAKYSDKFTDAQKKQMYKALEKRAKTGDQEAMYRFAKLAYEESNPRFFPLIFKWVSLLAAQTRDPAVWMLLGDLLASGYGTEPDLKRALSSYEQALTADIALEQESSLPREAHNYLEQQIEKVRRHLQKQK